MPTALSPAPARAPFSSVGLAPPSLGGAVADPVAVDVTAAA